jgi:peptidoglycan/LPS O-acetylase OafA/YrhL
VSTSLHTEPLGHVPALDGIRALAVVAVLVFHGDVTGAGGGFLGVSVFFTLSGFLITSLLLREWAAGTGAPTAAGIDLRRFWSRRFRRLLPASWLTVGLVLLLGWAGAWDTEQLRALRGDVPWSLAELVNWHFIIEGTSYGAAQSSPSPLEHFWSLAIEQQFYVLLPALLMLLLARGDGPPRRRLRTAAVVLAALAVASAVANGLLAGGSVDRAYFGTDTRAAELLVGALLAFAMLSKVRLEDRWRRVAVAGGALATAVLVVLFHTASLTSRWLYPWGLLLTAACTAALVVGAVQRGPLASALALRPMVLLGRISYGVYLLHWPVFLWLDEARTGLDGAALFAVRVVVSLAAATAMYHLVEMPIRTGRRIGTTTARVAVPCAAVVLLAGSFALTRDLPPPPDFLQPRDPGEVQIREVPTTTTTTTTTSLPPPTTAGAAPTTTPTTAPPPPPRRPQRVLLVGDSVAASLEDALGDALVERGISFATAATPGCGLLTGDPADAQGTPLEFTSACNGAIPEVQSGAVSDVGPDLVVALSTWEAGDRVVDGTWYQVGTPAGTDMMRRLYGETIQRLSARGATVAFLTIPDFVDSRTRPADTETNRRLRYVNDLLVDIGATYLGPVTTMRLDRIVCPTTPCPTQVEGVTLRPGDGAHFDDAAGARFAAQRLADQIAAMDLNDPG